MEEQKPSIILGVLIFDNKGKIFLMRDPKWYDMYFVPGGHIKLGETAEQTAVRGVKEETELDIYDVKYLTCGQDIYDDEFYKKVHFCFFGFTAKTNEEPTLYNNGATNHIWITPKEALRINCVTITKELIKRYINLKKGIQPTPIINVKL